MEYDRVFCTQYTPPCMKNTHFDFKIAFSIVAYLRLIKLNTKLPLTYILLPAALGATEPTPACGGGTVDTTGIAAK